MKSLDEYLREAEAAHGHLCAGQVLGVRMAMLGLQKLGIEDPRGKDRRFLGPGGRPGCTGQSQPDPPCRRSSPASVRLGFACAAAAGEPRSAAHSAETARGGQTETGRKT